MGTGRVSIPSLCRAWLTAITFWSPGALDDYLVTEIGGPLDWKDRFVTINSWGGEPLLLPYDSKMPIVVYLPINAEVRYKVWRAESEMKPFDAEVRALRRSNEAAEQHLGGRACGDPSEEHVERGVPRNALSEMCRL